MPKILPRPLFDPKNPRRSKLLDTLAAPKITGFAEGGTVGPAGRTFDQITGTAYLSEAERLWYLAQLAQQGTPVGQEAADWYNGVMSHADDALALVNKGLGLTGKALNVAGDALLPAPPEPNYQVSPNILQGGTALDAAIRQYDAQQSGINALETGMNTQTPDYVQAPEDTLLAKLQAERGGKPANLAASILEGYGRINEETAIPYVTPALRKLPDILGKAAKLAGDTSPVGLGQDIGSRLGLPTGPDVGNTAQSVVKTGAGMAIPTTGLEIAMELAPGGLLEKPREAALNAASRVTRRAVTGQQALGDALMQVAQRVAGTEFTPGSTFAGIPISSPRAQKGVRLLRRIAEGEAVSPEELRGMIEEIRWAKDENYIPPKRSPEDEMGLKDLSDVLAQELGTSMNNLPTPTGSGLVSRTAPPPPIPDAEGVLDDVVNEVSKPAPKQPKAKPPITPENTVPAPEAAIPDTAAPTITDDVRSRAQAMLDEYKANPAKTTKNTSLSKMDSMLDELGGREVNPTSGKSPRSRQAIAKQIEDRLNGIGPSTPASPEAPGAVRTVRREKPSPPDVTQVDEGMPNAAETVRKVDEQMAATQRAENPPKTKFTKTKDGYGIKVGDKVRATIRKVKNQWRVLDPTGATYPGTTGYRTLAEARDAAQELFEGVPPEVVKKQAIPNPEAKPVVPPSEAVPDRPNQSVVNAFNRIQNNPYTFTRWTIAPEKTVNSLVQNLTNLSKSWLPERSESINKIFDLIDAGKLDDAQRVFHENLELLHRRMSERLGIPYEQGNELPLPDKVRSTDDVKSIVDEVDAQFTAATGEKPQTKTTVKKAPKKKSATPEAKVPAKTPRAKTPKAEPDLEATPIIDGGTIEGIPAPAKAEVIKNADGSFTVRASHGNVINSETTVKMANPELAERYANQLAKRFEESGALPGGGASGGASGGGAGVPPNTPPLGEASAIPDPEGGAGHIPPQRMGQTIVGGLRDFGAVMNEVVPQSNKVVRAIVGHMGVNPSILADTIPGKALVAYARQRIAGQELTSVALSQLDAIGDFRRLFKPDAEGFVELGGKKALWNDVFENPADYTFNAEQKQWLDTTHQIVTEMENTRRAAGLQARRTSFKSGELWIPRQVEEIRGAGKNFLSPSNPAKRRYYETVAEGYDNGVRYKSDPRAVLETYLRQGYNEITLAQMNRALEPISMAPSELIPAAITKARVDAAANVKKWQREVARLRWNRATTNDFPEYTKAKKWHDKLGVAEEELKKAKDVHRDAVLNYQRAASRYSQEKTVTSLWPGEKGGNIAIGKWRGRFFKEEDYNTLASGLDSITGASKEPPVSGISKAVRTVGDFVRLLSATADFGAPFIQGLPVLAQNPRGWMDATLSHYKAFLDPTIQAKFMRAHLATFQDMARYGVPIGDVEVFKAMTEGGNLAHKVTGAIPFAKRFQSSYDTFLALSKAHLWEGLDHLDPATRARTIRNMTGSLDTRALGVSRRQAAFESAALAFSPRLLRSTVGLLWQAAEMGGAGQMTALSNLGKVAAGATMTTFALGYALGMSPDEMFDPNTGILNPLSGKEFMSVKVGDNWVGIGGQIRAMSQFMTKGANAIATGNFGAFTSLDVYDNPLLGFYVSRGAPFLNVVGGAVEAFTNWDTLPYQQLVERDASLADRLGAFGKFAGSALLPFSMQALVQTNDTAASIKSLLKGDISIGQAIQQMTPSVVQAGTEFIGLRGSTETPVERRAELIPDLVKKAVDDGKLPPELGGVLANSKSWSDITARERKVLAPYYEEAQPGLLQKLDEQSAKNGNIFAQKREEVTNYWNDQTDALNSLWDDFLNGASGGDPNVIAYRRKQLEDIFGGETALYEGDKQYQDAVSKLSPNEFQKSLNAYYAVADKYKNEPDAATRSALTKADQQRIIDQAYRVDPALGARLEFNTGYSKPVEGDPTILQKWAQSRPTVSAYYDVPQDQRADWRANNPAADFTLWFWGYVSTLKSPEAVAYADRYVHNRTIKADY